MTIKTRVDVNTACAEEEEFSGHFLHRSLSLCAFLLLQPLPSGLESKLLCENLHLSPRAQVSLSGAFTGNRCAVCAFVVTFGTLSRSSCAVVETGVCVHDRPTDGLAFNGSVQFSWIVRRKQICDFVHIVGSLIPPVTVSRDCITVSLHGELPAACNPLRSVSHCLNVNSSFVFSRQGTG